MSTRETTPEEKMAAEIGAVIDQQLTNESPERITTDAYEEQSAHRVVGEEKRTQTRLLIFTTNKSSADPASSLGARLLDLATMFAEIHVVVLNIASAGPVESGKLGDNVWLYATNSRHSLDAYFDGKKIAGKELEFANGFRADIVLALDPYLSGVVAGAVAKKFNRPLQVHLTTNIFDSYYQKQLPHPWVKSMMLRAVFKQAASVRVAGRNIQQRLLEKYPELATVTELIPTYVDLLSVRDFEPSGELPSRYPESNLIMLFLGPLREGGGVMEALEAARLVLQYPTAALLIIGEGPLLQELQKRVETLHLSEQVMINPPGISELTALHESHFLIYPGGAGADNTVVMKAAAAGLPMAAGRTELVNNLFTDDVSALICNQGDVSCLRQALNRYLNENVLRKRIAREARADIFDRVEQDVEAYKNSIRISIEKALYDFETPDGEEFVTEEQGYPERPTS